MPIFRYYIFYLAVFASVAAFYFFLTWSSHLPVLGGDHAVYLLMADHFSPFSIRTQELTQTVMRYAPHPPFYPLLLGLSGGTSDHLEVAHLVTAGFFIVFLLCYFVWTWGETGNHVQAFLLTLIFALLPTTLLQNLGIQSENLYMLLTLAAIWLVSRHDVDIRRLYLAAILIGLATVTRTIGVSLIAGFFIYLHLSGTNHRYRLLAVSLVPLLVWNISKAVFGYEGGYLLLFSDILSRKPLDELIWDQLGVESHALWSAWLTGFDPWPRLTTVIAGSLLLTICIVGTVRRAWRKRLDGVYVLVYLGVLLLWPFSREAGRFLYAILPLLLFHGLEQVTVMLRYGARERAVLYSYAYFPIVLFLVLAAMGTFGHRMVLAMRENPQYIHAQDWYTTADLNTARETIAAHQRLIRSWKRISTTIPPGDCVYHVDPASLMVHADRASYPPPLAISARDFREMATACRYFYLGSYVRIPYRTRFYPGDYIMDVARVIDVEYMDEAKGRPLLGMLVKYGRQ